MNYCGLNFTDTGAAPGICITLYVSGCEKHCPGCHNPETWDLNFGKEFTWEIIRSIVNDLCDSPIPKKLCLMGGDPLHPKNRNDIATLIKVVKCHCPDVPIYLWTGYTLEELKEYRRKWVDEDLDYILKSINVLIDGPFVQEERDITLSLRGSKNQRIINLQNGEIISIIK